MADEVQMPTPQINTESSLVRGARSSLNTVNNKTEEAPKKSVITKRELTFREKLKRSFVKEDVADVRDYVIFDIVIPSIRKAFFDTIVGTAAQIFGMSVPTTTYRPTGGYSPNQGRITPHERQYRDYNSIAVRSVGGYSAEPSDRYDRFYVSDWTFPIKEEADRVLTEMMDICDSSGWVTVGKFFELADPGGTAAGRNPYTNYNYGWHSIDNAGVKYIPNVGYIIVNLPPARPR
jgi:hypothetical protein